MRFSNRKMISLLLIAGGGGAIAAETVDFAALIRKDIGLDQVQSALDQRLINENITVPGYTRTGQTGDARHWLYGLPATGRGIVVSNSETALAHPCVLQMDSIGKMTTIGIAKGIDINTNLDSTKISDRDHGTATANIMMGSGNACSQGVERFVEAGANETTSFLKLAWNSCGTLSDRGIAPGATYTPSEHIYKSWPLPENSHVHNMSFWNAIQLTSPDLARHDSALSSHANHVPIVIHAVGNAGGSQASYGEYLQPDKIFPMGYFSMGGYSKNNIRVGATRTMEPMIRANFSSMGPLYDGRIGIDVMAPGSPHLAPLIQIDTSTRVLDQIDSSSRNIDGVDIWSYDTSYVHPVRSDTMTTGSGTSFAAPVVSGVAALLLEKYRDTYLGNIADVGLRTSFWNSTVRALLIHTATDINMGHPTVATWYGRPYSPTMGWQPNPDFAQNGSNSPELVADGPDWATGYGLVNAKKAMDYVDKSHFSEEQINSNELHTYDFNVSGDQVGKPQRVSLVWDDPADPLAGASFYYNTLKNDLDLSIMGPNDSIYRPWNLDGNCLYNQGVSKMSETTGVNRGLTPAKVQNCQGKRGVDRVNNVEVVDFTPTVAGTYQIQVFANGLRLDQSAQAGTNQDYSLVYDLPVQPAFKMGGYTEIADTGARAILDFNRGVWHSSNLSTKSVTIDGSDALQLSSAANAWVWGDINHDGTIKLPLVGPADTMAYGMLNLKMKIDGAWTNSASFADPNATEYLGNVQVFASAAKAGMYDAYLGQVEVWCGKKHDCTIPQNYGFYIPTDHVNKLAMGKGDLSFKIKLSGYFKNNTITLDSLNLKFSKASQIPKVQCIWTPYPEDGVYKSMVKQTIPRIGQTSTDIRATYKFVCNQDYQTKPWCQLGVYQPQIDPDKTQIYWPAAFHIVGECQ